MAATYPWPPRVLDEREAAYYLGVSPATFRAQIMPTLPPFKLTAKRQGWDRLVLDAWVDARSGHAAPSAAASTPIPNPLDAALGLT